MSLTVVQLLFGSFFFLIFVGVMSTRQNFDSALLRKDQLEGRLNGKHLNVILGEGTIALPKRQGEIIRTMKLNDTFQELLTWMSQHFNFSYSSRSTMGMTFDSTNTTPGVVSYLLNGESDMIIHIIVMTSKRFQVINFPHPWFTDPLILLIPNPFLSTNIGAVWQPFQFQVWLTIGLSPIVLVAALKFLNNWTLDSHNVLAKDRYVIRFRRPFNYVFGTLLNQGGYCNVNYTRFRLVTGSWCLAAFFIVNIYSCTLISHLFAPKYTPLIRSIYDLVDKKNVQAVVKKNYGIDSLTSTAESGILKQIGDKIRSYPKSKCKAEPECVEMVKLGSHVYIDIELQVLSGIREGYQQHGQCEFAVVKEPGWSIPMSLAVPKNSSFMEDINRGVLAMQEAGLTERWMRKYKPIIDQCPIYLNGKERKRNNVKAPISIKNLTGAFVILCSGYGLSVIYFIGEILLTIQRRNKRIS